MRFAGLVGVSIGILLVVLSANGRLQPTIAAMLGQGAPGATPLAANNAGAFGSPTGNDILNVGATNPFETWGAGNDIFGNPGSGDILDWGTLG